LKCRKHSRLGFGVVQKHNSAVIVAPVLALSFLASMIGGGAILGGHLAWLPRASGIFTEKFGYRCGRSHPGAWVRRLH